MYIKKFVGESLDDIQERINAELGPNAVVLTTRTMEAGFLQHLFFDEEFEVTAGVEPDDFDTHQHSLLNCTPTQEDKARLTAMSSMRRMEPLGFHISEPRELKIPVTGPLKFQTDQQNILVLVGHKGVGKTTTLTKLALHLQKSTPHKVALASMSNSNEEPAEELHSLARMFSLEHVIVNSPQELQSFMQVNNNHDIFLLDTPGDFDVVEIATYFNHAPAYQVLLVISATENMDNQVNAAEKYKPLNPIGLVITKLNEKPDIIMLSQLALQQEIPISYLAEGSDLKLAESDELETRIINERLRLNNL